MWTLWMWIPYFCFVTITNGRYGVVDDPTTKISYAITTITDRKFQIALSCPVLGLHYEVMDVYYRNFSSLQRQFIDVESVCQEILSANIKTPTIWNIRPPETEQLSMNITHSHIHHAYIKAPTQLWSKANRLQKKWQKSLREFSHLWRARPLLKCWLKCSSMFVTKDIFRLVSDVYSTL